MAARGTAALVAAALGAGMAAMAILGSDAASLGMAVVSHVLLAATWGACWLAAALLAHSSFSSARVALVSAGAAYRDYRMVRVLLTIPLYATAFNALLLSLVAETGADELWGLSGVFHYDTGLDVRYLLFCGVAAAGAMAGGGAALAARERWDDAEFWTVCGAMLGGWVLAAGGFAALAAR